MKKVFTISLLFILFSNVFETNAAQNENIIFEETSYYESYTDSKNGKEKLSKLTEKEYMSKKEERIKEKQKKLNSEKQNQDDYESDALKLFDLKIVSGLEDGGGSRTSLILTPNSTMTDLECVEGMYNYCEGSAERNNPMTKLHLKVSYDPESVSGMRAVASLTWDGAPNQSIEDFLSISYDGGYISAADNTIVAKQVINFDEIDRYWWGGVKSRTPQTVTKTIDYDPASPDFVYSGNGVIFNVKKVYVDYTPNSDWGSYWPIFDDDKTYLDVEIDTAIYSLEFDIDLEGDYTSYEALNKIAFAADYRHTYYGVNVNPKLSVRGYLTGASPYAAFLNLDLTIDKVEDGTRRITLDIYNYDH